MNSIVSRPTGPAFALLCLVRFMVVLDLSIVNLALPFIQKEFGMGPTLLPWVISGYALLFGGFLLLAGRAGDLFGHRRMVTAGLVVFTLASLFGGLASTGLGFLLARGLQGLGAAFVAPGALALTAGLYDDIRRPKAFGIASAVTGLGVPVGALLGGLLVAEAGWRWVMGVNVPVGVLCLIGLPRLLDRDRVPSEKKPLDWLGALTVTGGLLAFVLVLSEGGVWGWTSLATVGLSALTLVLLALFVVVERRNPAPLIRFEIFRNRSLLGANLGFLLGMAGFVSCLYILTFEFQTVHHFDPMKAGLAYLPMSLVFLFAAATSARLLPRFGMRALILTGTGLMALGYLVLTASGPGVSFWFVLLPGTILVGGYGFAAPMMFLAGTKGVAPRDQGLASGLLNTSQQLGGGIGLAATSAVALSFGGLQASLWACCLFLVLSAAAVTVFVHRKAALVAA